MIGTIVGYLISLNSKNTFISKEEILKSDWSEFDEDVIFSILKAFDLMKRGSNLLNQKDIKKWENVSFDDLENFVLVPLKASIAGWLSKNESQARNCGSYLCEAIDPLSKYKTEVREFSAWINMLLLNKNKDELNKAIKKYKNIDARLIQAVKIFLKANSFTETLISALDYKDVAIITSSCALAEAYYQDLDNALILKAYDTIELLEKNNNSKNIGCTQLFKEMYEMMIEKKTVDSQISKETMVVVLKEGMYLSFCYGDSLSSIINYLGLTMLDLELDWVLNLKSVEDLNKLSLDQIIDYGYLLDVIERYEPNYRLYDKTFKEILNDRYKLIE